MWLETDEVERVLAMVDASAAELAPEEHGEDFEAYAAVVRTTGRLPGSAPIGELACPQALPFLGLGLAALGQIALAVLFAHRAGRPPAREEPFFDLLDDHLVLPAEVEQATVRHAATICRSALDAYGERS